MIALIWLFLAGVVVGAILGWEGREYKAKRRVQAYQNLIEEYTTLIQDNTVLVEISKEGDTFIVHNADTKEFMGQANSQEELTALLRERYPDKFLEATRENMKAVGYNL